MVRLISRYLLLTLAIGNADFLAAATIGKIGPGGDVLYVRLTAQETANFEAGDLITIVSEVGDIPGMILSKKGDRGRLKLDAPAKGLVAQMEIKLVSATAEPGAVNESAMGVSTFPASSALNLIRSPANPWTTYIDTAGSGTTDGSGREIFNTYDFVMSNTSLQYLFLFNQFQVGPEFSYFQSTNNITNNSTVEGEPLEVDPIQIKYTLSTFGVLGKYLFRPYQAYTLNPHAYLGFSMSSFVRVIGDKDPQKADVQTIKLGFGAQYFLTATLAFEGGFEYRMDTVNFAETETSPSGTGSDSTITDERINQAVATMGINYGLAFYF